MAVLPFAVWRLYVGVEQCPLYGLAAFFPNPHDFGIPFGGIAAMWRAIARGEYYPESPAVARAAIWYPLVLTGGWVLAIALSMRKASAVSVAAVAYGLIAVSLNMDSIWGGVGGGLRDTFELFVMLAAASVGWRAYSRPFRAAIVSFWGAAGAFVFVAAVAASTIRQAIVELVRAAA